MISSLKLDVPDFFFFFPHIILSLLPATMVARALRHPSFWGAFPGLTPRSLSVIHMFNIVNPNIFFWVSNAFKLYAIHTLHIFHRGQ